MIQPRLSICIATVNRAAFLGATLDSIVSQVDQADDEVEIVIVDGASTDNTEDVVKDWQRQFSRLRYHRLREKGGVDQDYCRAIDLAQGDYCWLFTDDDILMPGAVQAVLAETQHDYGLILVNAEVRNAGLSERLEDRRLQIVTNRFYPPEDREQLFIDTVDYLSFIGGVVIKRSVWNERDKRTYYGTVFVHVGVIFQAPMAGGTAVLAAPLIAIRYGNALWTPRSFEISLFKWPALVWSFAGISESAKSQAIPREPWHSLKALLIYRARGAFSMREYRALPLLSSQSSLWRLAARGIALIPGLVLNACLVVFFSVFGGSYRRSRMKLVDLKNSRFYYRRLLTPVSAWFCPGRRQRAG